MSDFYLTLPSNSSMGYYPQNTLANFTTRLPNAIDLKGDWEVGLVEIQYPHNWLNIADSPEHRNLVIERPLETDPEALLVRKTVTIRAGYYPHIQDLLFEIMERVNENLFDETTMQLTRDIITRKVTVMFNKPCTVILPDHISKLFGNQRTWTSSDPNGGQITDLDPVDSLYVYCDVLEPRIVGDSLTPLLRIVPVEGRNGEFITRIYENVHYVRLQRKTFQTIEINIRDRTGKNVPFEAGTLNVTLHFRQRKRLSTL